MRKFLVAYLVLTITSCTANPTTSAIVTRAETISIGYIVRAQCLIEFEVNGRAYVDAPTSGLRVFDRCLQIRVGDTVPVRDYGDETFLIAWDEV